MADVFVEECHLSHRNRMEGDQEYLENNYCGGVPIHHFHGELHASVQPLLVICAEGMFVGFAFRRIRPVLLKQRSTEPIFCEFS